MQNTNVYDKVKIAKGDYADVKSGLKFGAATIGTAISTIWSGGTALYVYPDIAGEFMEVVGASTSDTDGGAGLWDVLISGLDENWNLQLETLKLKGQVPVPTTKKFARVWRMVGLHGGTVNGQVGDVDLTNLAGNIIYAQLTAATVTPNQTQMAVLSVPRGHRLVISDIAIGVLEAKKTTLYMAVRLPLEPNSVWQYKANNNVNDYSLSRTYEFYVGAPELADVEMRGLTASGTEQVTVGFSYAFVTNRRSSR